MSKICLCKNNRGFTIGEIVMTMAIMMTLSSIVMPNLQRIKMNTSMELVKQHMRIIGEKITEFMGTSDRIPTEDEWAQGGTGDDELSLTANLSSIDTKGYTIDDFQIGQIAVLVSQLPNASGIGLHQDVVVPARGEVLAEIAEALPLIGTTIDEQTFFLRAQEKLADKAELKNPNLSKS